MRILVTLSLIALGASTLAVASPGDTDEQGCHQCWDDCEEYGLEYGEWHCHKPQPGEDVEGISYPRHEIHPIQEDQDTDGPAHIRR